MSNRADDDEGYINHSTTETTKITSVIRERNGKKRGNISIGNSSNSTKPKIISNNDINKSCKNRHRLHLPKNAIGCSAISKQQRSEPGTTHPSYKHKYNAGTGKMSDLAAITKARQPHYQIPRTGRTCRHPEYLMRTDNQRPHNSLFEDRPSVSEAVILPSLLVFILLQRIPRILL